MLSKKWLKVREEFDDWRDFWQALGDWGYTTDFTYRDNVLNNQNLMLLHFLADWYSTNNKQLPLDDFMDWDIKDRIDFAVEAKSLGLKLPAKIAKFYVKNGN